MYSAELVDINMDFQTRRQRLKRRLLRVIIFLRGLIANEHGELLKLREEITALAKYNSPVIRADPAGNGLR